MSNSAAQAPWGRLERLLERIPSGYWTSYGDVAEVLGTGARAVGTRLSRHGGPGAYRVLRSDGTASAGFLWSDPAERRSVREVLESEGVEFGPGGKAARELRLRAADLEDLLDMPEMTSEIMPEVKPEGMSDGLHENPALETPGR